MAIDKSQKFIWLVRLGFAARGIVYALLGYIALESAGEAREGATSVFDYLAEVPLGGVVLTAMALGLLAYAVFRLLSAVADIQNKGGTPKGLVGRFADLVSGLTHLALTYAAWQFATGEKRSAEGGGSEHMAGSVLDYPLGEMLIGLIGIGFLIGAVMQGKQAVTAGFMKRISGSAPAWTKPIGRAGHAARAVVFAIIGYSLVRGAWLAAEHEVKGLGEAILSLRDAGLLFTLVAAGLIFYGVFSLLTARYRIIPDVDKHDLKPTIDNTRH